MSRAQWKASAIDAVFDFMRKGGLVLDDLTEIGGADLKSKNPKKAEKAKRVEKCWSFMARFSISHADLAAAAANEPTELGSGWRGKRHFSQATEIAVVSEILPIGIEANEINDLTNSTPTGDPEINVVPSDDPDTAITAPWGRC